VKGIIDLYTKSVKLFGKVFHRVVP